ncbi:MULTISPECIES: aminotransferase class I/II-fold pyridoxal phosphate-dependent enzyme [Streptomycetaceae]|uniref:Aspartate/tyrosine/aromatic aminotransferase-like protein n=1 Tax=Streptantibioticus cattleyicolor (strain ATCC 35852 / DSM 46488 / JCM 4925 / NBRC 14057 / NRRL 8057) TaxID=1003195 RepID=F8JYN5_STREN|nr:MULTISPECIES: aminotransferase class I/II-fold pyridoxal phosphate-dependent enzyme [Streptomycetaceae]AEW97262.1 Aspartate/tyrosine/aromatic aminotransferase-like protein [Streptantibioticus cattleyicolor NRRL 8057 = DSM 46488]MYS61716.1 aminotransferase class I/II-fold pyridoxal phosphate-dependent enzyme [Streptomyces sp. SID5468]CCB77584.1 conserved protein of unknown function [Streptantibioticus cattleyicolor NRRL 8057 = DSM 46488]
MRWTPGTPAAPTDPGLPVPPWLAERLAGAAGRARAVPVGGARLVREAAAGYWERRGLPTTPERVLLAPGPGPLLLALLAVAGGDLVVARPHPAWYPGPAALLGRRVHPVSAPAECGGVPDPVALLETVRRARAEGGRPRLVMLTVADDPTGTVVPPELVREVCEAVTDAGLLAVSDETYRDLPHDPHTVLLSPAEALHGRTLVLTDLAGALLPPGWPAAVLRFPLEGPAAALAEPVRAALAAQRAHPAAPVAEAARYALAEPATVREHTAAAARLHATVARAAHRVVTEAGALCPPPGAGFHLYPDLGALRPALAPRGVTGAAALETRLPGAHGGHHFGDDPAGLRVRLDVPALYGGTDGERAAALAAADPPRLPHVAEALTRLRAAFAELTTG